MRCESNIKSICAALRAPPRLASLVSRARPTGGSPGYSISSLRRRTQPLASSAASAPLVPGSLKYSDGRPCSTPLPPVRSARTVSLIFHPCLLAPRTPVISSQAPHHRLHHPAPHGPFHGPLVAVTRNTVLPKNAPKKVMARRASIMITASPMGEEEAVPSG